ncbi:MAG TPA: class B sortase [Clostridiales bacterium]|nr:class B sortase [Clostridiales bacterium]HBK03700.1 class B sortase [Clostridiales bacterium]
MKKILFTLTVLLLVVAFGVSAFMVGNYLLEGKRQDDQMKDLASQISLAQSEAADESLVTAPVTEPKETKDPNAMLPGYDVLYQQNSDAVGWIKIEGTKLNEAVLQTPNDPNFYLYADINKQKSDHGSIYAWSTADVNKPSDNVTLFGHNMKDGSKFACLGAYTSKTAWDNNNLISFDTLTEYHMYKIFAVFKTSANEGEGFKYHQFVDAANEQEFNDFVSTCKKLAFYDTGITPVYGDKLLCLSTCEYTLENGRLVVAAVRIT